MKAGEVYLRIANDVLLKWSPEILELDRQRLLSHADYDYLENNFIYGHSTISEAVISLRKSLKEKAITLPRGFTDYVKYDGVRFDTRGIREEIASLSMDEQAEIVRKALSDIHDQWVRGHVKLFDDPGRYSKRYQFMPIELIGFKDVMLDMIFLEPIIEDIGMNITESRLHGTYYEWVVKFRYGHKISSRADLINYVMRSKYSALDEWTLGYLSEHYAAADDVANQIMGRLNIVFDI